MCQRDRVGDFEPALVGRSRPAAALNAATTTLCASVKPAGMAARQNGEDAAFGAHVPFRRGILGQLIFWPSHFRMLEMTAMAGL